MFVIFDLFFAFCMAFGSYNIPILSYPIPSDPYHLLKQMKSRTTVRIQSLNTPFARTMSYIQLLFAHPKIIVTTSVLSHRGKKIPKYVV